MEIKLGNLTINFNGEPFLGPINCTFTSGQVNLIVGHSGCGKSTLLKIIAGFHKDYKGVVSQNEDYFKPQGKVALAFQNPESIFFNQTAFEEVAYSLRIGSDRQTNIEHLVNEWLQKWGLDPRTYSNKYPFNLSGGEKRRLALAACTILRPDIILLDEPLAGLDRQGQIELSKIIHSLSKDKIVIIVTHEPELLLDEQSHIIYINNDKVQELTAKEFLYNGVINQEFYPLPDWYVKAVSDYAEGFALPLVNAEAVYEFLKQVKQ